MMEELYVKVVPDMPFIYGYKKSWEFFEWATPKNMDGEIIFKTWYEVSLAIQNELIKESISHTGTEMDQEDYHQLRVMALQGEYNQWLAAWIISGKVES